MLSEITKLIVLQCCVLKFVIKGKFLQYVLSLKLKLNGGIMTVKIYSQNQHCVSSEISVLRLIKLSCFSKLFTLPTEDDFQIVVSKREFYQDSKLEIIFSS